MPKRFTIGPLGEHDDHWLAVWSALTGKSKAALATSVIGLRVKQNKGNHSGIASVLCKTAGNNCR